MLNLLLYILPIISVVNSIQTYSTPVRDLNYIDVIYRPQRGANPNYIYSDNKLYKQITDKQASNTSIQQKNIKEKRNEYLKNKYSYKYYYNKIQSSFRGHKLYRELEYHTPKKSIFIHHTALDKENLQTFSGITQNLKYIQLLHTFYRGWGDIGYHFLIGPDGSIFEGRFGGPNIIGAHAQYNNIDSIGISLLGEYNHEYISPQQYKSLIKLLLSLSQYYNIDPNIQTIYHNKIEEDPYIQDINYSPIAYHKLVSNTACPGKHIISLMSGLQKTLSTIYPITDSFSNFQDIADNYIQIKDNNIIYINTTGINLLKQSESKQYDIYLTNLFHQREKQYNIFQQHPSSQTRETLIIYTKKYFIQKNKSRQIVDK